MPVSRTIVGAAALAMVIALQIPLAAAQQAPAPVPDPGPSDVARQIGRLALIAGAVSFRADATTPAAPATVNYPLTQGNEILAEPRSHAAVDVGAGRIYLDAATELEIGALDTARAAMTLHSGSLLLHIFPGATGQSFEIATPRGTARISHAGYYEIVAGDAGHPTMLSVLAGAAEFVSGNVPVAIPAGQRANIAEAAKPVLEAVEQDDFIQLVAGEEQDYAESTSEPPHYVSVLATGYQDLQRYGLWELTTDYGPVWEPQVGWDWAPYRVGHWVDIAPWGLTWIDDAPWGFTPFHYGRWVQLEDRWAWVPGDAAGDPVYAPALVSFFGDAGADTVGWVPLGPEEVYQPAFVPPPAPPVTITNVTNVTKVVNVTQQVNVTNVVKVIERRNVVLLGRLVNRKGATFVPGDVLRHANPVAPAFGKMPKIKIQGNLDDSEQRNAPVILYGPNPGDANKLRANLGAKLGQNPETGAGRSDEESGDKSASKQNGKWLPATVLTVPEAMPPQFKSAKTAAEPAGDDLGSTARSAEIPVVIRPPALPGQQPIFKSVDFGSPAPRPVQAPSPATAKTASGKPVTNPKPTQTTGAGMPGMDNPGNVGADNGKPALQHCIPTVGIACVVGP